MVISDDDSPARDDRHVRDLLLPHFPAGKLCIRITMKKMPRSMRHGRFSKYVANACAKELWLRFMLQEKTAESSYYCMYFVWNWVVLLCVTLVAIKNVLCPLQITVTVCFPNKSVLYAHIVGSSESVRSKTVSWIICCQIAHWNQNISLYNHAIFHGKHF